MFWEEQNKASDLKKTLKRRQTETSTKSQLENVMRKVQIKHSKKTAKRTIYSEPTRWYLDLRSV